VHVQKANYKRGNPNLASNWSFLTIEDGPASFRIFLTSIFLVLVWTRGATASEDRFRLGVNFAVLGWIRMMLFEGEGAFLPKRTQGQLAKTGS
jgi:hypothetical protein